MKSEIVVSGNMRKLNMFVKTVLADATVKVGIMGDRNARTEQGMTNARLGAIHELGWPPANIPPRSFLRMPIHREENTILKQTSVGMVALLVAGKKYTVLQRLGIACENAIQRAFESRGWGNWKPDKPRTISRKGSDAPLIDSSQLRRSITSKVEGATDA